MKFGYKLTIHNLASNGEKTVLLFATNVVTVRISGGKLVHNSAPYIMDSFCSTDWCCPDL